ncbi:MAG: hypothetical protein LBC13_01695 [Clostridiales bacterium]|jgi:uncharacterized integral membrane protein|nr:hypothetical protein [Clostridiales bacterium]
MSKSKQKRNLITIAVAVFIVACTVTVPLAVRAGVVPKPICVIALDAGHGGILSI